ncbi:unnamed protein product [Triticum turgidum subsp. durum]|uniref:non-specific serine/threonine protein kinase n=1 Tax=Triticum turgidum subsp. durum TaxID=4567 RepID=A0A9R0VGW7_TRITD|nr:unnamed protein product [Triticum turgidum subsp. durum]
MATTGVLILLLLLGPTLAAADFCDNVKAVGAALSKNASSSPVNFATSTFGQAPDVVYALALCLGDGPVGSACGDCISNWFAQLNQTQCNKVRGISFLRCPAHAKPAVVAAGDDSDSDQTQEHAVGDSRSCSSSSGSSVLLLHLLLSPAQKTKKSLEWQGKNSDFSLFEFEELLEATNNFSEESKLGQGGFGAVYKGQLADRSEIAVKRLASHSGQGFIEFKNEVQLIAKLQHTNLVRLLGCCSQEEEKILVYEYLPNKSLDFFIFDENRRALLDWTKLLAIIEGVAHGLLYLHKHSRLLVIHRDLKPSNILLDSAMNPKISDFGLAKIFSSNDTEEDITRRVVGTYGYMAPEYASKGIFSIKSDVFSFGVIIFEILSGKRNSGTQQRGGFINLLGYAWQLWEEGKWIDLVDASLIFDSHSKIRRCINIALLCVQENAVDRPTMGDIVSMLSNETMILAEPKQPAYINVRVGNEETSTALESYSINDVSISITSPR